jgi:serine/threonine protein kinase/Tol biopolymer transport system component
MGEVYRARDTRLHRDVALKILPEQFASDLDRVARFHREALVLASLSHANVAAIHGIEEDAASRLHALVLELVEGLTLADRLAIGPLPLEESLAVARQIVDGLHAAHGRGVVHRDLKPSNIKIRDDGTVKVLDFGLAKMLDTADAVDPSMAPTRTSPPATRVGVILGTPAYMAPEQARGQTADARSDIWAFGVVLYEMLTGVRPFEGGTVSEVISEVLKSEPDWNRLPAETPESIRRLLRRCLKKDLARRLHDIADAALDLDDIETESRGGRVESRSPGRERWLLVSVLVATTTLAALAGAQLMRQEARGLVAPESRFEIATERPPEGDIDLAISPDGLKIVYAAVRNDETKLWLRSLDSVAARPLPGTENAVQPFWASDSRSIAFFAGVYLKRIDVDGGTVNTLARAAAPRGGTWNRDGSILFAPTLASTIALLPAAGGRPTAVTRLSPGQVEHFQPRSLPDSKNYLYHVRADDGTTRVVIGDLGGSNSRHLLDADDVAFHPLSGHLLFLRQGTLFSQAFDPVRFELTGVASPLADRVAAFDVSDAGPIVYRTISLAARRQFVWFDRAGEELARVGEPDDANTTMPDLSPNGRYVALTRTVNGNRDVWLLEVARGLLSRFTSHPAQEGNPIWSPDGQSIVFNSNREVNFDLYVKPISGTAPEDRLLTTTQSKSSTGWSSDGRLLLFRSVDPETSHDLWALPLEGDRTPFPVVRGEFIEPYGQLSPDGKWIAYQSDESGRAEVYVRPFRNAGTQTRISTDGGAQMRWRHDGRELIYVALDGRMMAVPLRLNGDTLEAGAPVALFAARIGDVVSRASGYLQQYVMTPDATRFLVNSVVDSGSAPPITVILNWRPDRLTSSSPRR